MLRRTTTAAVATLTTALALLAPVGADATSAPSTVASRMPAGSAVAAEPEASAARAPRVLDVALTDDGGLQVLADRRVPGGVPVEADPGPDQSTALVEVALGDGGVLRREVVVDDAIRAELPREGSTELEPTRVAAQRQVVHVPVPDTLDAAALTVRHAGTVHRTTRARDLRPPARGALVAAPTVLPIPGWTNGPASNRLDIVVLGDGYTAAQQSAFLADARALVDKVAATQPYATYRQMLNAAAVFAPSAQTGADQPAYSSSCRDQRPRPSCCPDPAASGSAARNVDTRYESTFCSYGIDRLLVPINERNLYADAAAVPGYDQILLVVNDAKYGGSGGPFATTSRHAQGSDVLIHEIGHSLLKLDDEYDTFTPGYPPCSDNRRGGITLRCDANVTDVTDRTKIKWRRWINAATPIPTTGTPGAGTVGLFQGAHYSPHTWYRSCHDCLMRSLAKPLGAVGSEQLPLRLHDDRNGYGVDLVEPGTAAPNPAAVAVVDDGATQAFSARVLSTNPGAGTSVTWRLDGAVVASGNVGASTISRSVTGDGAHHTLTATVESLPGVLHPTMVGASRATLTWRYGPRRRPVQAVTNGGFERAISRPWVKRGVQRVCGKPSRGGRCAARLTATPRRTALLTQRVALGVTGAGDTVTVRAALDPKRTTKTSTAVLDLVSVDGRRARVALTWSADKRDRKGYAVRTAQLALRWPVRAATLRVTVPKGRASALLDDVSVVLRPRA
jgi:hypothetical protein